MPVIQHIPAAASQIIDLIVAFTVKQLQEVLSDSHWVGITVLHKSASLAKICRLRGCWRASQVRKMLKIWPELPVPPVSPEPKITLDFLWVQLHLCWSSTD